MILKEINIEDQKLKYFVGINQVNFDYKNYLEANELTDDENSLIPIFNLITYIENRYNDCFLQFINDNLIIDENHILSAVYFLQKAFQQKSNILNKKSMELLLYLATKRQIKKGLENFGLTLDNIKEEKLTYCIVSLNNNIKDINQEIINKLQAEQGEITLNFHSIKKINKIKKHYKINDNHLKSIFNSYGFKLSDDEKESLSSISIAFNDILCEKMSILSLEKIK